MTCLTLIQSSAAEIDDLTVIESVSVQIQYLIALFCFSQIVALFKCFKGNNECSQSLSKWKAFSVTFVETDYALQIPVLDLSNTIRNIRISTSGEIALSSLTAHRTVRLNLLLNPWSGCGLTSRLSPRQTICLPLIILSDSDFAHHLVPTHLHLFDGSSLWYYEG